MIFLEDGVNLPALQGDLEYLPYNPTNRVPAFRRASEMLNLLLAKAAGTQVETIVRETPAISKVQTEVNLPPFTAETPEQESAERRYLDEMTSALRDKKWKRPNSSVRASELISSILGGKSLATGTEPAAVRRS